MTLTDITHIGSSDVWNDPPAKRVDLLITAASWEPRFLLGLKRILDACEVGELLLLHFEEHDSLTARTVRQALRIARDRNVTAKAVRLSYRHPEKEWKGLRDCLAVRASSGCRALVDISTMPRETAWTVFHFLDHFVGAATYAYHSPLAYAKSWLSQDPESPRLVLQMSGRAKLGQDTALVVTAGFDGDRTIQLVRAFDPVVTLVALQTGNRFGNEPQRDRSRRELSQAFGSAQLHLFDLDAFAPDRGRETLMDRLRPYLTRHNVVMASLGPKLSAVPLYQIHRVNPEIALVYSPARSFNPRYSRGIGLSYFGSVF